MKNALFPSKIASGTSFCNRENERQFIKNNIEKTRHTLIISPRRYGKTSLALKAIGESKLPFAYINLFNTFQNDAVAKKFSKGLSELLTKTLSSPQKAFKKLSQILVKSKLSLEVFGSKFELNLQPIAQSPLEIIENLLENIEKILESSQKKAVIFLDEFQDISKVDMNEALQSVLRDFAQRSQHVSLIISGSHRHMLNQIFDDRNKPFYKLCDRINLEKIKAADHTSFIQKHAKAKWKSTLSEQTLEELLNLTEKHPYYVNRLCAKLWESKSLPNVNQVQMSWQNLGEEEFDSVVNDLNLLSKNQRILLQAIAKKGTLNAHTSGATIRELQMPQSSIVDSIKILSQEDFIELSENGYQLIDPLIKYVLATH